jgi:iron(III) transport system ATP-binding protein
MADPSTTGPASGAAPISIRGITKSFGSVAVLAGVSLEVAPGELVALLGPSGCGKTTLLRILAGLEVPDAGEIVVRGATLTSGSVHVAPERRQVGMVFQDWALFPHLSVAKNVAYGLARDTDKAARVRDALAMVELDGLDDRLPSTLSGGQQQRVALARAIAPQPDVLLLDEPFSNLDTALRVQVRADLHRLLVDLGITTVFVTHDQEEAFVLGDRVAVMNAGHVLQASTPAEIYRHPADRWVAGFVGEANFLAARPSPPVPGSSPPSVTPSVSGSASVSDAASVSDERVTTVLGDLPVAPGAAGPVGDQPFDVLVRPEDLDLDAGGDAQIDLVEFYGHDTVYVVRVDDATTVRIRAGAAPRFARHDRVTVRYTGPAVVAYPAVASGAPGPSAGDPRAGAPAGTAVHAVEAGIDTGGESVTGR